MMKIMKYNGQRADELLNRAEETKKDVTAIVSDILETIRKGGDKAVLDYCEKFDGVRPETLLEIGRAHV